MAVTVRASLRVDDHHRGTPEATWQAAGRLGGLDPLVMSAWPRAVVLSPHPDDEVLGCGGLLQALAASGVELTVVAVTDGEGSHPGSPAAGLIDLRAVRAAERACALDLLGVAATVVRLGIADGRVASSEGDVEAAVTAAVKPGDVVVAPWPHDGHPDHDAIGRAAATAAAAAGADLLQYLVWAWHWATPEDIPWSACRRLDLDAGRHRRKAAAVGAYRSQVDALGPHPADGPVLPGHIVERLVRTTEVVVVPVPAPPPGPPPSRPASLRAPAPPA